MNRWKLNMSTLHSLLCHVVFRETHTDVVWICETAFSFWLRASQDVHVVEGRQKFKNEVNISRPHEDIWDAWPKNRTLCKSKFLLLWNQVQAFYYLCNPMKLWVINCNPFFLYFLFSFTFIVCSVKSNVHTDQNMDYESRRLSPWGSVSIDSFQKSLSYSNHPWHFAVYSSCWNSILHAEEQAD